MLRFVTDFIVFCYREREQNYFRAAMNENDGGEGEGGGGEAAVPPVRRPYCFRRNRPGPRSLYSCSMRALLRRYLPKQVHVWYFLLYFLPLKFPLKSLAHPCTGLHSKFKKLSNNFKVHFQEPEPTLNLGSRANNCLFFWGGGRD